MSTLSINKNAIEEVNNVLGYFHKIEGNGIIAGQHTQTMEQAELTKIQRVTGKLPALCGFELLSYSPNIRRETAGEACLKEVDENKNTLEKAWEWAEKGGLITFTWHWFSPRGGKDKSFFSANTDFDPRKALIPETDENKALINDLDCMAKLLKPFCEKHIPILWRPFHESEGDWFWWSSKGADTARELFRFMYEYYTQTHKLDNLIWVWNSPLPEGYVGDEFCDIISCDMYPDPHAHGDFRDKYDLLVGITPTKKLTAIGETGVIPDADMLKKSSTPWIWYMTWSGGFALTQEHNYDSELIKLYNHSYTITLDKLPKLYV